jgi:YHS domain-containing protein
VEEPLTRARSFQPPFRTFVLALIALVASGCTSHHAPIDTSTLTQDQFNSAAAVLDNTSGSTRLAAGGFDAVSYFNSSAPLRGSADFAATHHGATYRFTSAANRDAFLIAPERYAPAYGGWCATAMAGSGSLVDADPENYSIDDGRLYLFFKFLFIDARPDWAADPAAARIRADGNWSRRLAMAAKTASEDRSPR